MRPADPTRWPYALRMAYREARGQRGRLLMVALCLGVGFAAFVATYGFSGRVMRAMQAESRALLGADAVLSTQGILEASIKSRVQEERAITATAEVVDMPTLGATGSGADEVARLLEVRAFQGPYPMQGQLQLQGNVDLHQAIARGVVVDGALAQNWGLSIAAPEASGEALLGSRQALRLGGQAVPISGIIQQDDARQASAFALGPRIYLDLSRAATLGLVTSRSRLSSRLLLSLTPGQETATLERLRQAFKGRLPRVRVQSHEEAAAQLAQPLRNLNRFIRQLGLLTLLLALLGAWAILGAFLEGRRRDAAILRCLGAPPQLALRSFGILTAGLIGVGALLGTLLGVGAAQWMPKALGDLIPTAIRNVGPGAPPWADTMLALILLALMVAPALLRLSSAQPLALLREGTEPPLPRRAARLSWSAAALLSGYLIVRNAPTLGAGIGTLLALALLLGALALTLRGQLALFKRSAPRMPLALRLAFGQLGARSGVATLVMSVMGLALFLLLASQFVKDDLIAPILQARVGDGRPNLFLIDLQPPQMARAEALAKQFTGHALQEAPVVRARLRSVAGKPVQDLPESSGRDSDREPTRGQMFRTREQNLTWRSRLSASERVTAGAYWLQDDRPHAEWSLEEGFAKDIGAALGDELVFDVQGLEVKGRVTSLRRVNWQSLAPNFFIVAHPSLLKGAPSLSIAALEAPEAKGRQAFQSALARELPNVSVIDLTDVAARVDRVLDLVAQVARALAALMIASALLVLGASLLSSRLGRQRDLALLRSIGAKESLLLRSLAWEFGLLGGAAALTSGLLAWGGSWLYAKKVLDLPSSPHLGIALLLLGLASLLTLVVGFLGSWRALRAEPLAVLRGE